MNVDSDEIIEKARLFSNEIKNTDLYKKYAAACDEIKSNPTLSAKLAEYKKLHAEHCRRRLDSGSTSFDDEKMIGGIYCELKRNKTARVYLESEKELIGLYHDVVNIILESSGIDVVI